MNDFFLSPVSDLILAILALFWFIRANHWKEEYNESEMWCEYWLQICRLNNLELIANESKWKKENNHDKEVL